MPETATALLWSIQSWEFQLLKCLAGKGIFLKSKGQLELPPCMPLLLISARMPKQIPIVDPLDCSVRNFISSIYSKSSSDDAAIIDANQINSLLSSNKNVEALKLFLSSSPTGVKDPASKKAARDLGRIHSRQSVAVLVLVCLCLFNFIWVF